jgi:eukaryotic-like serine/threonine-protein kinase
MPMPRARPRGAAAPDGDLILGRFRMIEQLGSGGHGTVWIARDERLRRNVALKRIARAHDARKEDRRRIGREALAAARLSHPAIVAFYEALSDERAYYLVTELVHGSTLAALYAGPGVDDRDLMRIGVALADALGHAHDRGVVHRDVKPQNVMIPADPHGAGAPAKLTDFGVAHLADEQPLTEAGDVIGTLAYMAPEQAHGEPANESTDLYALALTLYEGFAGGNPLRGATAAATVRRLDMGIPPLTRTRRDLPPRLCAAIDRALSPEPARRGKVADLRAALTSSLSAKSPRPRRFARRPAGGSTALTDRGERLVAGAGACALSAIALGTVLGPHPIAVVVAVAFAAFVLATLAPSAGWLLLAFGLVAWLALAGQPGTAVILCVAFAPVPVLLAADPWLWSVPLLGPALGALGVAAAYPGLAARGGAASPWRRAALGALGYWWVALTEELANKRFFYGLPSGVRPRSTWADSVPRVFSHALAPLCTVGHLAPAVLWAIAALILPWLLRARTLPFRALGALVWAAALILTSTALAHHLGVTGPPLPIAAALLACAVALTIRDRPFRVPARAIVA